MAFVSPLFTVVVTLLGDTRCGGGGSATTVGGGGTAVGAFLWWWALLQTLNAGVLGGGGWAALDTTDVASIALSDPAVEPSSLGPTSCSDLPRCAGRTI